MLDRPEHAIGPDAACFEKLRTEESSPRLDCRVLLAEDAPDNQRLISLLLTKAGAVVQTAENGEVACEKAISAWESGEPFDVILMDMQMPVLDGCQATRRLREAGYPHSIVAVTANAMAGQRQKCLEAGCDEYITKPIRREQLLAVVEQSAGKSKAIPTATGGGRGPAAR